MFRNVLFQQRYWIAVALAFCVAIFGVSQVESQEFWTPVVDVSQTESSATWPTIATDQWGGVHVIWAQKFGGKLPSPPRRPLELGDTLYYSRWDDEINAWTPPADIIIADQDAPHLIHPSLKVGNDGFIYAVWSDIKIGLRFGRAPMGTASNTRSWELFEPIVEAQGVDRSQLLIDENGGLHVLYSRVASSDGGDGNVAYIRSDDKGNNWTRPRIVSAVNSDLPVASLKPRMAFDDRGGIHAVWVEATPPRWLGERIYYASSPDGGNTWTLPSLIGQLRAGEVWAEAPNIEFTRDGKLHLVYTCGFNPHRCYRVSTDYGQTWSVRERIFADMQSLAGWDSMVADGEGNLHFIAQLREPEGIYYSTLPEGGEWNPVVRVVEAPKYAQAHFPEASLVLGNQLHIVMQNEGIGDIWHFQVETASRPVPASDTLPEARNGAQAGQSDGGDSSAAGAVQEDPRLVEPEPFVEEPTASNAVLSQQTAIWIGFIPVALLVVAVVFYTQRKRRRF